MTDEEIKEVGKSDAFWRKVYFAVIIVTIIVVTALWMFSRHFS